MNLDPVETAVATALTGGGGFMLKVLVDRFFKRAEHLEEREETSAATHAKVTETKLDAMAAQLSRVVTTLEVMAVQQGQRDGEASKQSERIEGISRTHGAKLDSLVDRVTRLEERSSRRK